MKKNKKLVYASTILALTAAISVSENAEAAKKEKCYGIVKAGKNDCSSADGSHSCAGLSKTDGDYNEWVIMPYGTCDRVIGGSLIPGRASEAS